ncbi:hypothetical protein RRG08_008150 [Elysia crispata]|uniref:Uncharacterized protein n=1 Tax=Elysia crispata TaxID=231223 RepID=A0AAE0Z4X0_9GAST|nr:hypothetical protein RRG08_008150 [Elysia crispata]
MVVERALWGAAEETTGEAVGAEAPSGALMGVSAGTTAEVSVGVVMVGAGTAVEEVGAATNLGNGSGGSLSFTCSGRMFLLLRRRTEPCGVSVDRIASQLV